MNRDLWEKAVSFHGHECPGLAIGFKACEAAMEKLGIGSSDDEEIVCITENDACGVDAVQALLAAPWKRQPNIQGYGKTGITFFNRTNGKKLRVCLIPGKNKGMEREEGRNIYSIPRSKISSVSHDRKQRYPKKPGFLIPSYVSGAVKVHLK